MPAPVGWNGLSRLTAALRGEAADRMPIFCNLLDQGARELGMPLREYYADGLAVAEGQLRMQRRYGYDNLWSLFYVGKEAELLGCRKIHFAADGPPNVGELVIREPGDVERLRVPEDPAAEPAFAEPARCLAELRRRAGGTAPICAYLTATMTLPALLMGMERWMDLLLNGPFALRDQLLDKCHQFFVREVEAYRRLGADVLLYSNPFGCTEIVPPRLFRELSLPWVARDVAAVGTEGLVYYCGSAASNAVLEPVLRRTGIGAYYLSPLDDLAEALRILDGRALCCGIINDIKLATWSREEIFAEVRRLMHTGRASARFLFGTLVMPYSIPEANIQALMDAARLYSSD